MVVSVAVLVVVAQVFLFQLLLQFQLLLFSLQLLFQLLLLLLHAQLRLLLQQLVAVAVVVALADVACSAEPVWVAAVLVAVAVVCKL